MPATQEKKLSKAFSPQIIYCQTPASNIYLWAVVSDTGEGEQNARAQSEPGRLWESLLQLRLKHASVVIN